METCARPWMPAPMMAARTARPATGGDQQVAAVDPVATLEKNCDARGGSFNSLDPDRAAQRDAFGGQPREQLQETAS